MGNYKCLGKFSYVQKINKKKTLDGLLLTQQINEVTLFEKDGVIGMSVEPLMEQDILDDREYRD